MSQIFDDVGKIHPVTWLEAGPIFVTQPKTKEKDGYIAVQIGFGSKKDKRAKKPQKKLGNYRYFREARDVSDLNVGDKITVETFKEGEKVNISGITKGKGFQGVVKRHGFKGGRRTHGQKHSEREPGSIGAVWPQRVLKGKRMAGRMGGDRITVKNLKVIKIIPDRNMMAVEGAVPGNRGTLLEVRG